MEVFGKFEFQILLKTKHNFVARRDINTTNGGEQFLPHCVRVGSRKEQRRDESEMATG